MPIPYKHKRSTAAGVEPTTLQDGEIAINVASADPKIFYKDSASTIRAFSLASYASATHTHVAADITNFTSVANVVSVNAKTGVVSISHTDVTAASASHTHAASDVTSGTFDAARLPLATTTVAGAVIVGTGLGVSSGTVSVTYGTSAGTACQGNDSRLSDTRTPTDGSVTTAKLANDAVTYAKIQNVSATDRLLGRSSAGAGDVEEITCTAFGRSLIDDADAAAARTTLSVQPTASPAFTGAATFSVASGTSVPLTITNDGTGNSLVVNDATGDTTPFVIDASGNVGVGTSSPGVKLEVARASPATLGAVARFYHGPASDRSVEVGVYDSAGLSYPPYIQGRASTTTVTGLALQPDGGVLTVGGQLLVTAGSVSAPGVAFSGDPDTGIAQLSAGGANTLSICTGGGERVRVDASGNVGIGAAPAAPLDIGSSSGVKVFTYKSGGANAGIGTDLSGAAYECSIFAGGTADTHGRISFGRRRVDTGTYTEWMRIENDGVVKMIDVYGDTVGATNRDLFIDDTGKLGYVSSIRASKTGITAIDDVSWLRELTPVSFRYRKRNEDGTFSDEPDGTLDYGLIAEDVEPVAPELCFYDVVDGKPHLRGVHYSKLVTPMLRYIQQLEQRIAALEEKLSHG